MGFRRPPAPACLCLQRAAPAAGEDGPWRALPGCAAATAALRCCMPTPAPALRSTPCKESWHNMLRELCKQASLVTAVSSELSWRRPMFTSASGTRERRARRRRDRPCGPSGPNTAALVAPLGLRVLCTLESLQSYKETIGARACASSRMTRSSLAAPAGASPASPMYFCTAENIFTARPEFSAVSLSSDVGMHSCARRPRRVSAPTEFRQRCT